MTKLHEYTIQVHSDLVNALNDFCLTHNISYRTKITDIGDVTKNWKILNEEENRRLTERFDTTTSCMPEVNVPGLYVIGYGKITDPFGDNIIYIGESASKYHKHARTGVGQRLYMAIKDFIGMSSNHNKKFWNARESIANSFGDDKFDLKKLSYAIRPHEDCNKWNKHYSHLIEGQAIVEYEDRQKQKPICNKMCGTNLSNIRL